MSVVVGVLTIDLKANTASFSQSMDKMSSLSAKTANDIKRSLEKIALAGAAMAASLVTGTAALIESSVATIGSMSRLAQSAGTTAEKFSVLAYAAKLNHTPMEDLAKGLEKLSQSAFKAQNGNVQLERIFGKLGVTTKDSTGHLRDSSDILTDVAVKFSQMGTAAGKPALAMALFGKAGAQLIPLLNDLGKHQAEIREEAQKYGLVIGNDVPAKVRAYHEVLVKLHAAQEGFGMQLTVAVLPALTALSERLQELGSRFDIAKLAEAFGAKVTVAINAMVGAIDFAVKHVGLLKIALESLAALQISKLAIPIIADLAGGGIEKVGSGLSKLVISGLGLTKVIPALATFGAWLKYASSFVGLLAAEEGIGAAATYVFGGALAAVGGPITLAIAAIVGLGVAIYKFRDATFSLNGTTYQLRDTWNAAWIVMGNVFGWIGKQFSKLVEFLKGVWRGFIAVIAGNEFVQAITSVFGAAFEWIGKMLGKLTPGFLTKALDQAKAERLAKEAGAKTTGAKTETTGPGLPPPDTSGLGKQTESPVGKLLANLQEKLDESKQTLAAAGLEEEAQRKVAAANKASNEIMKLGEEIAKQTGAKTKDYASLVDQATQALIREKNAQISDIDAKTVLLNLMGNSARASALSIAQSGLMAQAMDKGSDAILRQTSRTQAWNELRAKGGSITEILARSQEIYAESVAKEGLSIQGNIINLQQELAARKIVNETILGSLQAQDEAALRAKLYALDVQIAGAATGELKDKLLALREAMIAVNDEDKLRQDLDNARSLQTPAKQYELEQEKLNDTVEALRKVQNGTISYGQSLQIAMKEQENFNQLIDGTVKALLFEGSAASGVKAFFLDMQKQAITAGQIIYDALHQAFTKLSENLTQLVTGGKTSFAQMFTDIGRQMVNSTIQKGLQTGLGALGKAFPSLSGPLGQLSNAMKGKADGSQNNPFWVQMASGGGMGGSGGGSISNPLSVQNVPGVGKGVMGTGVTSLGDLFGGRGGDVSGLAVRDPTDLLGGWTPGDGEGGDSGGGVSGGGGGLGMLGGLLSKITGLFSGGGGAASKIFGFLGSLAGSFGGLIPHADGGSVSPGSAYLVGERGPEILTGASGNITSNVASRRMLGGSAGNTLYYNIDARGTDPVLTEQRTKAALIAVHSSAISNAVQVNAERIKRTPQR